MLPAANAPFFGWECPSFFTYEQQLRPWRQVTNHDPSKRAAALILLIETVEPRAWLAARGDIFADNDWAERTLATIKGFLPRDHSTRSSEKWPAFLTSSGWTKRWMSSPWGPICYVAKRNPIGELAEAPPTHLYRPCVCRPRRCRGENNRRYWAARRAGWIFRLFRRRRRLFGPRGGAACQDVLVAADADTSSVSYQEGEGARAAYRKTKKQIDMKRIAYRAPGENRDKVKRGGQTPSGRDHHSGVRN